MYVVPQETLIWENIKLYSTILFYIDILLTINITIELLCTCII